MRAARERRPSGRSSILSTATSLVLLASARPPRPPASQLGSSDLRSHAVPSLDLSLDSSDLSPADSAQSAQASAANTPAAQAKISASRD